MEELASFGGTSFGGLLAPLRVLTFWQMKRRAREVGQSGVAALAARSAAGARPRPDSTSWVTASAASSSPRRWPPPGGGRRPVDSLALVQGAMSLWSFCSAIPSAPERAGYFHPVIADGLVSGPIVVTTSVHDRAVRTFYPIAAARAAKSTTAPDDLPTYGAIGTFGIRGPGIQVVDGDLRPVDEPYELASGVVYDLRADDVIRNGRGLMGAHSDIARPEVAHAVWQAALAEPGQ